MTEPYLILELTTSCNLDCIYCYNIWKEKTGAPEKKMELSLIERIIPSIITDTSICGITLTGGEPLLNDEIFDIVTFLSLHNSNVNITSNGILMTEENVKKLISSGMKHFEISLPSSNSNLFSTLCKSDDLKAVRSAMLNIKAHGANLSVTATVCKINYANIPEIIKISSAFGADYFTFNRFVPGGRGKSISHELMMNHDELMEALSLANSASAEYKIPVIVALPVEHCLYKTQHFKNLGWGTCGCGSMKWIIDPEGNFRTCEQNPDIIGNLLYEDFKTLSEKAEVRDFRKKDLKENCIAKECYLNCGGGCRYCR